MFRKESSPSPANFGQADYAKVPEYADVAEYADAGTTTKAAPVLYYSEPLTADVGDTTHSTEPGQSGAVSYAVPSKAEPRYEEPIVSGHAFRRPQTLFAPSYLEPVKSAYSPGSAMDGVYYATPAPIPPKRSSTDGTASDYSEVVAEYATVDQWC